jgi:putative aminopeptidase FrvX
MVTVDNATPAPGKNSNEFDVHIAMLDGSGPFDYHLSHKLIDLAIRHSIPVRREVFRYYRSDAATAVDAGNDIRTALTAFGVDASHGWERTHVDGLLNLARLIALYIQSEPTFERDKLELGPLNGFPDQPT